MVAVWFNFTEDHGVHNLEDRSYITATATGWTPVGSRLHPAFLFSETSRQALRLTKASSTKGTGNHFQGGRGGGKADVA